MDNNSIKNNFFKKITFGGFFKKDVIELIKINNYDRVYIDINNTDVPEDVKYAKQLCNMDIQNAKQLHNIDVNYVKQLCNIDVIWTNIQDKIDVNANDKIAKIKRRLNIAKTLVEILKTEIQFNSRGIVLLDSDMWTMYPLSVYTAGNTSSNYIYNIKYADKEYESSDITNICYLAKLKPTMFVNYYCMGTPMIIPSNYYDQLIYILKLYISNMIYDKEPVDIYIHNKLSRNHLFLNGICHMIDNNEYCTRLSPQLEGIRKWR
jgi:hypothetical protein